MKKLVFILMIAFTVGFTATAQDRIITHSGTTINCKIITVDSTTVYYTTRSNIRTVDSFINRSDVSSILYGAGSENPVTFGLGMGLDFGGFGGNLLVYPNNNIGLFAGLGYALAGLGFNAGTKIRFSQPGTRINPYVVAMYGYNAAIKVVGASNYNKMFYGPTVGFGLDFENPNSSGYWTAALMIPFRKAEVEQYMDELENNHGIQFQSRMFPIAFSVGYRFKFE